MHRLKSLNRQLIRTCLIVSGLLAIWWLRAHLSGLLAFLQDQNAVSTYVQGYGILGPSVLFGLLVAQVFLALIPGHALMMAAGYVYGFYWGSLIVAVSTILGSQMAFLVARSAGRKFVFWLVSAEKIQRWDQLAGHQGAWFYFLTFVLPVFPSDLMCFVAGLGKISARRFLAANFAGRLLCAVTITLIGAYGFRPPWLFWAIISVCLSIFVIGWGVSRHRALRSRQKKDLAYTFVLLLCKTYQFVFGVKLIVRGLENIPHGTKIFAANHPNASDVFMLPLVFPERIAFLAQANLFQLPILGWVLSSSGQIPVNPERKFDAYRVAIQSLSQGKAVFIFPEGKLNPANWRIKAYTGAVRLALSTGLPIIPIGIRVLVEDSVELHVRRQNRSRSGRWQYRGRLFINIGTAWYPGKETQDKFPREGVRELTDHLMEKIRALVVEEEIEE